MTTPPDSKTNTDMAASFVKLIHGAVSPVQGCEKYTKYSNTKRNQLIKPEVDFELDSGISIPTLLKEKFFGHFNVLKTSSLADS